MRRVGAVLWLALAMVHGASAITIDPDSTRAHAETIRNTYPRFEGSEGEQNTTAYVQSVLDTSGIEYDLLGFDDFTTGHSFSHVIDVQIAGRLPDTFLVFAALDHDDTAVPDGDRSASVAAALAFAEAAAGSDRPISYRVLFLGAERGASALGTELFVEGFFPESTLGGVYLSADEPSLVVETGGGGQVAPSWLVEVVANGARAAGLSPLVRSSLNQLHRLGFTSERNSLVTLLNAGVPTVHVSSAPEQFGPSPVAEVAVALASFLAEAASGFERGMPSEWDRHYLYLGFGRTQVVVPEYIYLPVLIAAVFGTLLYALVARRQLGRYLRTIGRNFWNLPVLFVLAFVFLSAGTLLLDLFLLVRRFPTLWETSPSTYVGLKISISILLFSLAAQLLRRLPLSKNGSFYSAAAIFVLFTDVILSSVLNLALSAYFLWAFLLSFVFSITPRRIPKMIALLLSPIPLIVAAVRVLAIPELEFAQTMLLSARGNLVLSFVTLPFLLMLIRLDFLVRHPVAGRRSYALGIVTVVAAGFSAVLLILVFVRPAYSEARPQPVEIVERIDYETFTRELEIRSPAPLGEFTVEFAGSAEEVSTRGRTWTTSDVRVPDVLSLRQSSVEFLDRNQARLTVDSPVNLDTVAVRFTSETPMTIYDVDLPYRMSADRLTATVFVGRRPPLPLQINYTTSLETEPRIEVSATSRTHPDPLVLDKADSDPLSRLEIRTVLNP